MGYGVNPGRTNGGKYFNLHAFEEDLPPPFTLGILLNAKGHVAIRGNAKILVQFRLIFIIIIIIITSETGKQYYNY